MDIKIDDPKLKVIRALLRPVLAYALRSSVRIQEIIKLIKYELVSLSNEELQKKKQQVTDSRLSIITGLHRKDISKFRLEPVELNNETDRITKIIGLWQSSKKYLDKKGLPKKLSYGFQQSEFTELVYEISRELNPATILFQLERSKIVEKLDKLVLQKSSYTPKGDIDSGLKIVEENIDSLVQTANNNLMVENSKKNLHVSTEFDSIPEKYREEIRLWLIEEGHKFHSKIREFLAGYDTDINKDLNAGSSSNERKLKISLTSFSGIQEQDDE